MPRTVWTLGFVSLLMDASSELVHSLLPLFLTVTLGASVGLVGLIDGIAEATAAIGKVPSGWISDRIGKRKHQRKQDGRRRRAPPPQRGQSRAQHRDHDGVEQEQRQR